MDSNRRASGMLSALLLWDPKSPLQIYATTFFWAFISGFGSAPNPLWLLTSVNSGFKATPPSAANLHPPELWGYIVGLKVKAQPQSQRSKTCT